jgi:hypothetical protein
VRLLTRLAGGFYNPHWTFNGTRSELKSGSNSVVECDLAKVEVAGSNPVSRSRIAVTSDKPPGAVLTFSLATGLKGAVPKW